MFGRRKQKRPAGPRENLKRGLRGQEGRLRAGTRSLVRFVVGTAKLAAVLGVLVLAGWGGSLLWHNAGPWMAELFRVREITVVGLQQVTRAEVLTRLRLDKQAVLYDIDPDKLVERLRTHPWIKDAELTRRPFHQLQVTIMERRPDYVFSGINHGGNMGDDVSYSGTVSAAMEATMLGIPSVAISLVHADERWLAGYEGVVRRLARMIVEEPVDKLFASDTLLNVNLPDREPDTVEGVRVTALGKRVYSDPVVVDKDPHGKTYYWIGGGEAVWEGPEG